MLSSSLRTLEHNGLITRTVHPTVPPQVDYTLTEPGQALNTAIHQVALWAETHGDTIRSARANHETAPTRTTV
jgi:DNA-binding HxlR family transcriptional regulator